MSQLTPCPECQRHVRKTEVRCPFCEAALSLAHVPPPVLPRRRMSRAATFAFGAGVVGATTLVACSDDDPGGNAVYGAPPAAGTDAGGSSYGGKAVYGAPPSGGAGADGDGGTAPAERGGAAGEGGAGGSSPDDAGGSGGFLAVYGAPGGFGGSD